MEEFGRLITAAFGLDTSWHQRAACRQYPVSKRVDGKTPWHAQIDMVYGKDVRGSELIEIALMICFACPAQYDCARYAVEGDMRGGTYAMPIADLRWLQDKHGIAGLEMITQAENEDVPVQVRVKERRAAARSVRSKVSA